MYGINPFTVHEEMDELVNRLDDVQKENRELSEENDELWIVLSQVWPEYESTYPATCEEMVKEHPILKAVSIWGE